MNSYFENQEVVWKKKLSICLAFVLIGIYSNGQSVVNIEANFNSSDTIVNYIRSPDLNAWDLRCLWNDGQNCFRYSNNSACAISGNPNFRLQWIGTVPSCVFLSSISNSIISNNAIGFSNIGGGRKLSGGNPYSTTLVNDESIWLANPEYNAVSIQSGHCPQYYDSTSHDLWTILNSVQGDSIDTIVPNTFSFKFVSGGTFFDLSYIFASDQYDSLIQANCAEYPYVNNIYYNYSWAERICGPNNDGAAIFLSGPGINGSYSRHAENVAVLPNGAGPICVRNIHPTLDINSACSTAVNPQYYIANSDTNFVFNGYTVPLSVKKIALNPCDTYQVFLTIADAGQDPDHDGTILFEEGWGASALIVKKHSAHTGFWQPAPLQLYDGYGQDTLVEGCPGVLMRFVRFFQLGQSDSIHLMYEGSTSWGADYDSLPEWVFFQPGQDTLEFLITPKADSLLEGIEKLVIRLMPPGVYNCPVDTTEVELWIADRPPFDAVMADTFFFNPCVSDSIAIGPSAIGGLLPLSYLWNTGATTPSINVAPLNNQGYSLTVFDACDFDSIVLTTVTRTAPAPQISLINNDSVINCAQGLLPIGFEVLANYYPQFEYEWASGETDSIIYVNPLENGTYNYSFKIIRPCMPDSFEYGITIHVENDPVLVDLGDEAAKHCPGFEYTLSPEISGGYLPYWFEWNSGDTSLDISVAPLVTDTYFFSVTDVCGLDTVVGRSIVNVPFYDSLIIKGKELITLPCPIGYVNIRNSDYRGSGGLSGSSEKDYEYSWNNWLNTGMALQFYLDHDTLLTLQMRDTCGVDEGELDVNVRVFNGPFLSAGFPDTLHVCLGDPVYLIPEVKDGVKPYVFEWGNGSTDSLRALVPETPISTYKITVSDFCDFVKTDQVIVSATRPSADFAETNDSYDPQSVTFENRSEGAITYTWFFGEENTSLEKNPTYHFETLSETQVKLVVEDRYGCQDSTERQLDIPLNLFIPNSFTPNGDNLNETWQPLGYGFETLAYTVFDRWGNEVYSCALPECFDWNGNSKGKPLQSGVYAYIITVKLINGSKREVTGQVNLMR